MNMNTLPTPGAVLDWAQDRARGLLFVTSLTAVACSGGGPSSEGPTATARLGGAPITAETYEPAGTTTPLGELSPATEPDTTTTTAAAPETTHSTKPKRQSSAEINWEVPVQTFNFDARMVCQKGLRSPRPSRDAKPEALEVSMDDATVTKIVASGGRLAIAVIPTAALDAAATDDVRPQIGLLPGDKFNDAQAGRQKTGIRVYDQTICAAPVVASVSSDGGQVTVSGFIPNTGSQRTVADIEASPFRIPVFN